jgi:hypothetical protein
LLERVPVSIREWKQKKDDPRIPFVSDVENDLLWQPVIEHINLPAGDDLRELVKSWALKKMDKQFHTSGT